MIGFLKRNKKWLIISFVVKLMITFGVVTFAQQPKKNTTEEVKIKTSAVCGMCKEKIEKGLAFEKGIKDVSLDTDTKIVTVTYKNTKTNPQKIKEAISKLGYDADEVKADPKVYAKLPSCCKKGADKH